MKQDEFPDFLEALFEKILGPKAAAVQDMACLSTVFGEIANLMVHTMADHVKDEDQSEVQGYLKEVMRNILLAHNVIMAQHGAKRPIEQIDAHLEDVFKDMVQAAFNHQKEDHDKSHSDNREDWPDLVHGKIH